MACLQLRQLSACGAGRGHGCCPPTGFLADSDDVKRLTVDHALLHLHNSYGDIVDGHACVGRWLVEVLRCVAQVWRKPCSTPFYCIENPLSFYFAVSSSLCTVSCLPFSLPSSPPLWPLPPHRPTRCPAQNTGQHQITPELLFGERIRILWNMKHLAVMKVADPIPVETDVVWA